MIEKGADINFKDSEEMAFLNYAKRKEIIIWNVKIYSRKGSR